MSRSQDKGMDPYRPGFHCRPVCSVMGKGPNVPDVRDMDTSAPIREIGDRFSGEQSLSINMFMLN